MWSRKRIDISSRQVVRGLGVCARPFRINNTIAGLNRLWPDALPVLSVRTGFDLALNTLGWAAGDEVLMSGLTIPDMPRIVRQHALVPVGLDLDAKSLYPSASQIAAKITVKTKAIVIAHLFGQRSDLAEISEVAKEHGILLIEDCAQAYCGNRYQGSKHADLSMFSFGPIKTNTALGGGLIKVRQPEILQEMSESYRRYPVQSDLEYARRLVKYLGIKALSTRPGAELFYHACNVCRASHDQVASQLARGFGKLDFFSQIRRQPAPALLQVLLARLQGYDESQLMQRCRRARLVSAGVQDKHAIVGDPAMDSAHWVMPLRCSSAQSVAERLWDVGFDATRQCSLRPICDDLPNVHAFLRQLLFVPFDDAIPAREIRRMTRELNRLVEMG